MKLLNLDINKKLDNISIASIDSVSSPNTRIIALEKQLDIETKVREGAENMLEMYSKNKNKKFAKEAKTMLEYSEAKIDYIKMMIDKIQENDKKIKKPTQLDDRSTANLNLLQFESLINQQLDDKQDQDKFKNKFLQFQSKSSSCLPTNNSSNTEIVLDDELISLINREKVLNLRVEELKARLKLELIVLDSIKNIILTLQAEKTDKNTIQNARTKLIESYQKIYLLRNALKSIMDKLDSKSSKYTTINDLLRLSKNVTTELKSKSNYTSLPTDFNDQIDLNEIGKQSHFCLPKTAAVCGNLEIKLIGIKNLLTKIERYDVELLNSSKSKSNYKINDKISNEIKAVLKLDNSIVGDTTYQSLKQQQHLNSQNEFVNCFNCLGFFPIDLDRNRELEIQFYYNDFREMCAFKHLYLEEFVDSQTTIYEFDLEPQGCLKFELIIKHPMMISKNKRLERKKMLRFKSETFLRPNQMNINIATWGRLITNNVFESPRLPCKTKSFASFTPASRKKLEERSSSSDSNSSSASICQIKLDKANTIDSFREEDEFEEGNSEMIENTSGSSKGEKPKIKDDKLMFIKKLEEQKKDQQLKEIEIASISSSEEEEIDLISMTVIVEEEKPKSKGLIKSKTENLRAKPSSRKTNREDLRIDLNQINQTRIESIDDSDEEDSDLFLLDKNVESNKANKQPNIIELDDDDEDDLLIDENENNYLNKEHPLAKFNLLEYEKDKNEQLSDSKETKWETEELKLGDFSLICTLGKGK